MQKPTSDKKAVAFEAFRRNAMARAGDRRHENQEMGRQPDRNGSSSPGEIA